MRKLTDEDMTNIAGLTVKGYKVEGVRIKRGDCTDTDNYGIILGRNTDGHYVTWQFHFDENNEISVYWGHYFMEKRANAFRDFNIRDTEGSPKLSSEYWDCECSDRYIHPNDTDRCPRCGAERDNCPDSRQNEVDEGIHFYVDGPHRPKEERFKTFEFFIDDLKDEAKAKFIEFLGGNNGNHDVIPFCTYESVDQDDTGDTAMMVGVDQDEDNQVSGLIKFKVTITETLKLTVVVEAEDQLEAEQIVNDQWNDSIHVLTSDNFHGVEFEAIPINQEDSNKSDGAENNH